MDAQRNALEIKKACEVQSLYHTEELSLFFWLYEAKLETNILILFKPFLFGVIISV